MKRSVSGLDDDVGERATDIGPDPRPVGTAASARTNRLHTNNRIGAESRVRGRKPPSKLPGRIASGVSPQILPRRASRNRRR